MWRLPSMKVGIVGLPNVGKSTLFNALLKKRVVVVERFIKRTVLELKTELKIPDYEGVLRDILNHEAVDIWIHGVRLALIQDLPRLESKH